MTVRTNGCGKFGVKRSVLAAWLAGMAVVGVVHAQDTNKPAEKPAEKPIETAPAHAKTEGVIRHGVAEAPAKPAGAVRVASYNIENLFAPNADGKMGDQQRRGTEPKPEAHLKAAAEAIRKIDADVIGLQEIESLETLTTFRDTYLKGLGYEHIASIDAGDDRGIEQSVLSRFPIREAKNWVHLPIGGNHPANRSESDRVAGGAIQFKRSPLMVTVELPKAKDAPADAKAQTLTLFVVHFKSGGRQDAYWREREADKTAALAKEVLAADPASAVVILGDFNARPQDKAFKFVSGAGFADAFGDLPDGDPKYITHSSDRVIDHLMLSPRAAAGLVKETRFVLGTMNRPAGVDWRTTQPPEGYASDHYPVVVDLDLAKMREWVAPAAAPAPVSAPAGDKKE